MSESNNTTIANILNQTQFQPQIEEDPGITWIYSGDGILQFLEKVDLYRNSPIFAMQFPRNRNPFGLGSGGGLSKQELIIANVIADALNTHFGRIGNSQEDEDNDDLEGRGESVP